MSFLFLMVKCRAASAPPFTFIRCHFTSLLLPASKMVSLAELKVLIVLPRIFASPSSKCSPVFCMTSSLRRLNRDIKCTLFDTLAIGNHSVPVFSPDSGFLSTIQFNGRTLRPELFRIEAVKGFSVVYETWTNLLQKFFGTLHYPQNACN